MPQRHLECGGKRLLRDITLFGAGSVTRKAACGGAVATGSVAVGKIQFAPNARQFIPGRYRRSGEPLRGPSAPAVTLPAPKKGLGNIRFSLQILPAAVARAEAAQLREPPRSLRRIKPADYGIHS